MLVLSDSQEWQAKPSDRGCGGGAGEPVINLRAEWETLLSGFSVEAEGFPYIISPYFKKHRNMNSFSVKSREISLFLNRKPNIGLTLVGPKPDDFTCDYS